MISSLRLEGSALSEKEKKKKKTNKKESNKNAKFPITRTVSMEHLAGTVRGKGANPVIEIPGSEYWVEKGMVRQCNSFLLIFFFFNSSPSVLFSFESDS